MNTREINNILFENPKTAKLFIGTFPSDLLPTQLPKQFMLCANLQPSTQPGSHWVAIARIRKRVYYFDSFGRPPPKKGGIARFCSQFPEIRFNNVKHQATTATTCGGYVIFVLALLAHGHSFSDIVKLFLATEHDDSLISTYAAKYGIAFHV